MMLSSERRAYIRGYMNPPGTLIPMNRIVGEYTLGAYHRQRGLRPIDDAKKAVRALLAQDEEEVEDNAADGDGAPAFWGGS